jgi:hypothetical protein
MQREAAEEGVGAIAEGRGDAGVAQERHPEGHERHQRLETLGGRDFARRARKRQIEGGRARIDLGRDKGAADAAFAMRRSKFRRIEASPGDDRRIARRGALGRSVNDCESLHLALVHSVERSDDDGEASRGIGVVGGAQGVARLVDRMRLHRAGLDRRGGKRGIGARRAGVRAGLRRRPKSADRAERIVGGPPPIAAPDSGTDCAPRFRRRAPRRSRRAARAGPAGT